MTHDNSKNDFRLDDLLTKARDLGTRRAQGEDTLIQFGLLCVEAAHDGVIDVTKDKYGDGVDDAVKAYAEFERARATNAIFNHKSPSGKVQASKLRSCIKLGNWTRGGPDEPIATVNKLMGTREKMRKNPAEVKLLDDAYNTLLRYARYQVKQNHVADDDALLRHFCTKTPTKASTLEEYIAGTAKRLDDLRKGKAAGGTLQHASDAIHTAIQTLREEITNLRNAAREAADAAEAEQEITDDTVNQ